MNHLYPVMMNLRNRQVLVVGGGVIGFRKAEGLVAAGAIVTAISPIFAAEWDSLGNAVTRIVRCYQPGDLAGFWIVITATNDQVAQQAVFDEGERVGVWVNAADDPDRCAFILPAVHRAGPVILSVSTSGSAPALAGWLRDRAAASLPPDVANLAQTLRAERDALHDQGLTTEGLDWRTRIEELTAPNVPASKP
jgi:precorrin-2 dehydrogenase / sirohydrochlorin ferrochelatase